MSIRMYLVALEGFLLTIVLVFIATQNILLTGNDAASKNIVYGIDINVGQQETNLKNIDTLFTLVQQSGATAVRTGINWGIIQPTSQRIYNWKPLDTVLSAAKRHNLQVLLEIGNTPSWDLPPEDQGNTSYPPKDCMDGENCQSVKTYITDLVRHVHTQGVVYIIPRNEPQNTPKNWVNGSADDYAVFLHVVYQAAHAANPNMKVLNGGEEIIPHDLLAIRDEYQKSSSAIVFGQSLYHSKLFCQSIDILDVHVGPEGSMYSPQIVDASENALQNCNGGKKIPVWVTEVGYPSAITAQENNVYRILLGNRYTSGESSQAQFLIDTYTALTHDNNVYGINWIYLADNITAKQPLERTLGLTDSSLNPKISFTALKNFIKQSQ